MASSLLARPLRPTVASSASTSGSVAVARPSVARPRVARLVPARVASVERGALAVDRPSSVDPATAAWSTEEHVPGQIWSVHSPQQLDEIVAKHADQLVVLMCKSKSCRPCKMFMKKYMAIAERWPGVVLLQIYGDESPETRKLMVGLKVKVTPTFQFYRGGERAGAVTGVSETALLRGIVDRLTPAELEGHEEDVFELEAAEREAAAAAVAAPAAQH